MSIRKTEVAVHRRNHGCFGGVRNFMQRQIILFLLLLRARTPFFSLNVSKRPIISFPDGIVFHIFLHLPRHSLHRFRFVSKAWLRRMEDVASFRFYFTHLSLRPCWPDLPVCWSGPHDLNRIFSSVTTHQFLRNHMMPPAVFNSHGAPIPTHGRFFSTPLFPPFNPTPIRAVIASTGDGLLLITHNFYDTHPNRLLVWNPAADRWTVVPPPPPPFHAFDDKKSPTAIGFVSSRKEAGAVFSSFELEFEVIIVARQQGTMAAVCTFSSGLGLWTKTLATTDDPLEKICSYVSVTAVAAGGFLYWPFRGWRTHTLYVQTYDVAESHLSAIQMPRLASSATTTTKLFWSLDRSPEGRLRYVILVTGLPDRAQEMTAWTLEKHSSSWRLEHSVAIRGLPKDAKPLGLDGNVVLWERRVGGVFYSYDFVEKLVKERTGIDEFDAPSIFARTYPFRAPDLSLEPLAPHRYRYCC